MDDLTPNQFDAISILAKYKTASGQRMFKDYLVVKDREMHVKGFYNVMDRLVAKGYAVKHGQGRRKPVRYTITTLGREIYEDYIYERENTNGN